MVFCFGLIHGLGFASALGIDEAFSWTLLSSLFVFNVGIEAVQLCIILAVFPLLALLRRPRTDGRAVGDRGDRRGRLRVRPALVRRAQLPAVTHATFTRASRFFTSKGGDPQSCSGGPFALRSTKGRNVGEFLSGDNEVLNLAAAR